MNLINDVDMYDLLSIHDLKINNYLIFFLIFLDRD